ncbi:unnamed protein product [Lupinus luteus]|uniref:Sister chromatid cohesion 1 protein 4-like n=1 Tax=Lupinus luteus TaxID=3873 RepID=A0AAV1Y249_LUPLU
MFYSQFILAKKGPLGTIWIAAHLERKLRKNQVADTDIGVSVDSILFPDMPIALRLSSHLLLGVVRIYSRKVNYLFDDCSEALLKVKQAFRSTTVDLPPEESTAPYHSITLPETFDLDDFELPDNELFQGNYVDHHVSTREQITLQDTMDGVVYNSSQFGLDERFGDGDASQIGLDLDEVLLTDKAATLEHDDCSAGPQKDEMKEEIDEFATAADAGECAQGPSTPGLEEPNLFGTQVDQVNNEVYDNNSTDLVSLKSRQEVYPAQQRDEDVIDSSLENNVLPVSVDISHEDDGCLPVELDRNREQQEHLECIIVTNDQDSLMPNDHCSTLSPLIVNSNQECASGMISSSGMPEKMGDLYDGALMNNEPLVTPLDQTITNCVVTGGVNVNETGSSPSCSHVTSDQENISCKNLSKMDGSREPESGGHLEDDHTLPKHEILNAIEMSINEGQSCLIDEAQVSNVRSPRGSAGEPQVVDGEAQTSQQLMETESSNHILHADVQPIESHLRPCTSQLSYHSLSTVDGENCVATDGADPAIGHHETIGPFVCEGVSDLRKSDVQIESQIFCDGVESISKSAASDMPEPEKMLSVAYQNDCETNSHLPMESTPNNQVVSDGHTGAAGVSSISGKKRSFTESTLTVHSVDFVQSYGGTQSKRTRESIPDDDDLLSSILAGRRSSVLKLKPSPVAPETVSMKYSRSAPRISALKRKVLIDDMMVLHGDTIRQQLTNTEDIRRIRKKAPCTQHEILMIQRQSAEDEIFHESIFTGLSAALVILRNDSFDLTGIKICDNGLDSSFLEKTNDEGSHSRTNTETHVVERNIETMAVQLQGDAEAQPTEVPVLSETHQAGVNLGSHDIDVHGHSNIVSNVEELGSSPNIEMNNASGNVDVSIAEKCSVGPGLESSSLTVSENNLCVPNDCVASFPLLDEANDLVGSMHTDIPTMPTDQNLNTFPLVEDEFVEKCNRSGIDAIEVTERSVEIRTQYQTDDLEANDLCSSMATGFKETDLYNDNKASFNRELPLEENVNSLSGGLHEDQIVASELGSRGCDDKVSRHGPIFSENTKVALILDENETSLNEGNQVCEEAGQHSVALVLDEKETSLNEENPISEEAGQHSVAFVLDEKETVQNERNSVCEEAGLQSTLSPEIPAVESPLVDRNDENFIDANDTGFLNVGDDEMIEDDDDDFMPSAEGSHLENSGWSSRTRAVAKYLQISFEKEDLHGRQNLCLDNILAGKTRKEASRMFFETLVLKTKDYVHVEQTKPFSSINIKPRMKLMKSDF